MLNEAFQKWIVRRCVERISDYAEYVHQRLTLEHLLVGLWYELKNKEVDTCINNRFHELKRF